MIGTAMMAVLAGFGAAALLRLRRGKWMVASAAILAALEGTASPFVVNGMSARPEYNPPEPRVYRPARAPAVYRELRSHAPASVLVELPLGSPDYDVRAVYYSTVHWRPLLNGYSGFAPRHYGQLGLALSDLPRHPELSIAAMRRAGATHVIVHEAAFRGEEGAATSAALQAAGAVEAYRDGADVLFVLSR
jgi:hypothetical protein